MKHFALIACVVFIAGCTGFFDPSGVIVDLKGVDREQYEEDLADCRGYADEVPVAKHVGAAATAGAVVGAAVGAISGNSTSTARGAGYGVVYGGVMNGASAVGEKRHVLRECMRGRGYRLLN